MVSDLLDAATHHSRALLYQALRLEIIEEPVSNTLREFIRRTLHGSVEISTLQAIAEEMSGKDLDGFFTAWVSEGMGERDGRTGRTVPRWLIHERTLCTRDTTCLSGVVPRRVIRSTETTGPQSLVPVGVGLHRGDRETGHPGECCFPCIVARGWDGKVDPAPVCGRSVFGQGLTCHC